MNRIPTVSAYSASLRQYILDCFSNSTNGAATFCELFGEQNSPELLTQKRKLTDLLRTNFDTLEIVNILRAQIQKTSEKVKLKFEAEILGDKDAAPVHVCIELQLNAQELANKTLPLIESVRILNFARI